MKNVYRAVRLERSHNGECVGGYKYVVYVRIGCIRFKSFSCNNIVLYHLYEKKSLR